MCLAGYRLSASMVGQGVRMVEAVQGIRAVLSLNAKASICVKWPGVTITAPQMNLLNFGLCHIFKIKL